MRISDWSSDVCSSDLVRAPVCASKPLQTPIGAVSIDDGSSPGFSFPVDHRPRPHSGARTPSPVVQASARTDRKSVGEGKGVSVRVDLGGRRSLKKNTKKSKDNATQ